MTKAELLDHIKDCPDDCEVLIDIDGTIEYTSGVTVYGNQIILEASELDDQDEDEADSDA